MKFREFMLLEEMFKSDNGYHSSQHSDGSKVVFDIETGEARDYRFVFSKKSGDSYIAELGYKESGKSDISNIKSEFYDVDKLISTLVGIFTGFYMSTDNANIIEYKFGRNVDNSYKLLVHSIVKKELSNYFKLSDDKFDANNAKQITIYKNTYNKSST